MVELLIATSGTYVRLTSCPYLFVFNCIFAMLCIFLIYVTIESKQVGKGGQPILPSPILVSALIVLTNERMIDFYSESSTPKPKKIE